MSNFLKKYIKFEIAIVVIVLLILAFDALLSCKEAPKSQDDLAVNSKSVQQQAQPLSKEFKDYWYAGEAEITSYKLSQARYGELREGTAVLIYVTEPFNAEKQVKADTQKPSNINVLKLNATKNFNTGIYPYSIMSSTFYPVANNQHAIKVSAGIQEWCGQVYMQVNNRDKFDVTSHSYFESEADESFSIDKVLLENEIWTQLRIDPKSITTGNLQMVPSLEYLRLKHKDIEAYDASIKQQRVENQIETIITYEALQRTLVILQNNVFPFEILTWRETYPDGNTSLTSTASRIKMIKSPYWQKNANTHEILRDSLGL